MLVANGGDLETACDGFQRGKLFGEDMWKGLIVTALCVGSLLAFATWSAERMRESYSFVGVTKLNKEMVGVLQPLRPISLAVVLEKGEPIPQREVLTNCDASSRDRVLEDNLSTKVTVHEMILTCGKRVLVVKGVLYDVRK